MTDHEITTIVVFAIICLPVLIVPIVGMLIKHQQQMAKLMRTESSQTTGETLALREEVQQLRGLVHQQSIMLDDLQRNGIPQSPPSYHVHTGS